MESPLERLHVSDGSKPAYALTLQLPLEGSTPIGGIKLVLKTPDRWLGCTFHGARHDMFISLQKARHLSVK